MSRGDFDLFPEGNQARNTDEGNNCYRAFGCYPGCTCYGPYSLAGQAKF